MLKKEAWVVLGIFLLFASLFIYFHPSGLESITGLATSDISFDVLLTKTSLAVGDPVSGYVNLTFTGPVDSSTEIRAEFDTLSSKLALTDYLTKKNISFEATERASAASNPLKTKSFNFASSGSKQFAFKIPKLATVKSFSMSVKGSNGPSFVNFDVEDYADKKEWKYFGTFKKYNSNVLYPSSLSVTQESDPIVLGADPDNNKTYFCEAISLPESKHFNLSAKYEKKFESAEADIKLVMLAFDGGDYAYGGADFCDLPEPPVDDGAKWKSCELSFETSKQGLYLICVFYEGDTENTYYELSRDGTPSDSRYDCTKTEGDIPCSDATSRDYFISVQTAEYTGTLDGTFSWEDGETDQKMDYSLTDFLEECEADEIGDCIVPVTISSESAGDVELSSLRIDYKEEGGATSYTEYFYDFAETTGQIVKLDGVDLSNGTKTIQIPLSEFNLTAPSITETLKTFYLEVNLIPGGKVSKPVKVYGAGYVPETETVEDKINDAKKAISDMQTKYSDELDLFGIDLDLTELNSFESQVNALKADTNLSIEEINNQLSSLANEVDSYLKTQPKSFSVDTEFRDLYVPEPSDVEEVVLEDVAGVYSYQNNVEVSVDVANYLLTMYDGSKKKYSAVTKTIIPKKVLSNVYVYEVIPKTLVSNVANIVFKNKDYEVVEQDPIVRYTFPSISQSTAILYGVKDVTITPGMLAGLNSIIVPQEIEEVVEETPECGDGVCTEFYEDEASCPEDCGGRRPIPWVLIIVLVVILIAGVVYINFYKGKGAFRKLVGRTPFVNPKDLASIKNYIKAAQDKGIKNQSVASALLKSGWTRAQIIYAFEDLKWDEKRLFTIKFAPGGKENVKKLKTFIKKCLQLGIPEAKIRNILVQKGWDVNKINEVFAEVGKPKEKVVTEKEEKKKVSFYFEKSLAEEMKK